MTSQLAIECRGLTKDYGTGRGILDLDLDVEAGEVFGFIGPNGAGKTTTVRLLMDFVHPTRGTARLMGLEAHRDSHALKHLIGYLPGELPLYPGATVAQILGLLANLRGTVTESAIRSLAGRLDLDLGRRYRDLSHGNKQKVWLVQAFMHNPRLLILDEPTLGLDPLVQAEFHAMVEEAAAGGATVFLSSHVLSEVQSLCDRIALVSEGHLIRMGTLDELRELRVHRLEATYAGVLDRTVITAIPGVSDVQLDDHRLRCRVHGDVAPLLAALAAAGTQEIDSEELSLEEVFIATYRKPAA